jgi:hypothetical protein
MHTVLGLNSKIFCLFYLLIFIIFYYLFVLFINELGESESFYNHIRSNRETSLIILYEEAETIATDGGLSRALPFYLSKIAGFFSLECMLLIILHVIFIKMTNIIIINCMYRYVEICNR